ncbi:hypothetical protein [Spirosoma koreense]
MMRNDFLISRSIGFLAFVFFCLSVVPILAQDSTIQYRAPSLILKLAPLSLLLDPDATVQGALEVRVSPRNSIQGEVGFGHKGLSVVSDEKQNFADWSIWRVRSEWRHYTNHYRTNAQKNIYIRSAFPLGNYVALEGFAKQINGIKKFPIYDSYGDVLANQQSVSRFAAGGHIKWGRQIAIPGETLTSLSRVLLDFYMGIGIRYGATALDPFTEVCGCGYDRFQQGHSFQPSVSFGAKIGFGF